MGERFLGVCVAFLEFMVVGRISLQNRLVFFEEDSMVFARKSLELIGMHTSSQALEEREVEFFKPHELLNDSCIEFWIE
jgi:hypothetical protein